MLLTTGHVAFAISFVINLAGWGKQRSGGPTFFVEPAAPKVAEAAADKRR
jgi:cytochrome c oxidase cbb3-type subunit I